MKTNTSSSFEHAEVFPVIARLIEQQYKQTKELVLHSSIVSALLKDDEGANLVEKAHQNQSGDHSREWLANNMVSWFSQQITVNNSPWERAFERQKVNGTWAYKPSAESE